MFPNSQNKSTEKKNNLKASFLQKLALFFLVIFFFNFQVNFLQFAYASKAGDDFLTGLGCNDKNQDGLNVSDCFDGSDNQNLTSFTNFQGGLEAPKTDGYASGLTQATDARSYILNVTNFALGFLGLIAVVIVIYGGIAYVTSMGDPEKAGKGKKTIMYAGIGLILVMGSFAIVNTILKAPSDSEAERQSVASQNGGGLRGVAGQARFNFLAEKLSTLMIKTVETYQFHYQVKQTLDNTYNSITATLTTVAPNCDVPFSACVNQIYIAVQNNINSLNNLILDPQANSEMQTGLKNIVDSVNKINDGILNTNLKFIQDQDCDSDNKFAEVNPCTEQNKATIRGSYTGVLFKILIDSIFVNYDFLKNSYQVEFNHHKESLFEIYKVIKGVSKAQIAGDSFNQLIPQGVTKANNGQAYQGSDDSASPFQKEVDDSAKFFKLNVQVTDSSQTNIKTIFLTLKNIYDIVRNIEFVNTILTADVVNGNAPLVVNFSTVGSTDPSGLTIKPEKIFWDLNGDGKFNGEGNIQPDANEFLNCKESPAATGNCIFTKPGTYRVAVRIDPADGTNAATNTPYNQEIAPGLSYIDIKVNPAASKINLTATVNNIQTDILKYNDKGFIQIDRSKLFVTLSEAKAGITFDATQTKVGDSGTSLTADASGASKVKWNFGTESPNNDITEIPSDKTLIKNQNYDKEGSYLVKLEVSDKNGIVDRKFFTIVVSSLAPRISNPAKTGQLNQEITFDGSNSSSDSGQVNFKWQVDKVTNNQLSMLPLEISTVKQFAFINYFNFAHAALQDSNNSANKQSSVSGVNSAFAANQIIDAQYGSCKVNNDSNDVMGCTFTKAGTYKVTLTLADKDKESQPEIIFVKITSNPPIANFNFSKKDPSQPATYILDSSTTFDPDEKGNQNFEYSWEIPGSDCVVVSNDFNAAPKSVAGQSSQTPCSTLKDFNAQNKSPIIKFTRKGSYSLNLQIRSKDEPDSVSDPNEKTITVENVLDVAWGKMSPVAILKVENASNAADPLKKINTSPKAKITFIFSSSQAVSYELDFGDGTKESKEIVSGKDVNLSHDYTKSGQYTAKLRVFDADDIENNITRKISIGDGDNPVAIIKVLKNGEPVYPVDDPSTALNEADQNMIVVNRKDTLTFDAGDSINTDGSGRRLRYGWDLGENQRSTKKQSIYTYKDITSGNPAYNTINLIVTNEDDVSKTGQDNLKIKVAGEIPTLRSITAVPQNSNLTTPVTVKVDAIGAQDLDGKIVQYKWWYSPENDPTEKLGVQITQNSSANLIIGTNGIEFEKRKYTFGLELTDDDNNVVTTDQNSNLPENSILSVNSPIIEVNNGPNKAPTAKITPDKTTVSVNEPVNFSSATFDPDEGGGIKPNGYEWDFGDNRGFNTKDEKGKLYGSNPSFAYKKANVDGYKVRLRITDIAGATATSESIKIFVEAVAGPPVAAFTSEQIAGTKQINFKNNSIVDTGAGASIKKYTWDFDISFDSNGDGKPDNDLQSGEQNPTFTYRDYGIYRARLMIEDNEGQKSLITNFVNVKLPTSSNNASSSSNANTSSSSSSGTTNSSGNIPDGGSKSSANNNLSKSAATNLFNATHNIDSPTLLASLIGFVILIALAKKEKKKALSLD